MNKLVIVVFALVAVAALATAKDMTHRGKYINENGDEVESPDGSSPGKFKRVFGSRDSLENGNGHFNLGRHEECPEARSKLECSQCCEASDKSSKFLHSKWSFKPLRFGKCVCFTRATL